MMPTLHKTQLAVKPDVAFQANDSQARLAVSLRMTKAMKHIAAPQPEPSTREGRRFNYISEWADRKGFNQADISKRLGVDKSNVSRWFSQEVMPKKEHLAMLAELFELDEPAALFRHPDDDWLARYFRDRRQSEIDKAIEILNVLLPTDDIGRRRSG